MKAVVHTRYGSPDVLHLKEVPKPSPKGNDVLIRVHATAVSAGDCLMRSFDVPFMYWLPARLAFGLTKPKWPIPGADLAGEVESVGKNVTRFKPGDSVFGTSGMVFSANAEYICLPEHGALALMPANMTYEEAAAVPLGALTALHFLRKAHIEPGHTVLIYGASGSVGTAAVQLAKHFGADVTGVCSTGNLELVTALGADRVIDYTKEDFTTRGETYDVIFDTVGHSTYAGSVRSLKPNGVYLLGAVWKLSVYIRALWTAMTTSKKISAGIAGEDPEELQFLKELIEAGTFTPVIDRRYPLEQIVEAHRYVDTRHKKGNVVITVQ